MRSIFLIVAAAALMPVSQGRDYDGPIFWVDCGTPSTYVANEQYCYYNSMTDTYYTSPVQVYAYEQGTEDTCNSDSARWKNEGGEYDCNGCEDKTSVWTSKYRESANVQLVDGQFVTNPSGTRTLNCDTFSYRPSDTVTYQILCHAQNPTVAAVDANGFAYCAPEKIVTPGASVTWTTWTWTITYYDENTCQAPNRNAEKAQGQIHYTQTCGKASTVTPSVFVTVISLVAALKAVF